MADPFDALRRPVVPLAPDPSFAARLRRRVERALNEGDEMTVTAGPGVRRQLTLTPYLAVADARRAIEWYADVFGAVVIGDPIVMPDGRIGHAELVIGDSLLMLADERPEIGHSAPSLDAGTHVLLTVQVADADVTVERAAAGGARVDRPVADTPYGHRGGTIRDPFGHRWSVQAALRAPVGSGDIAYFSLQVADAARARVFYAAVLGWSFGSDQPGTSAQVEGLSLPLGVWGGAPSPGVTQPGVLLVHRVDDIDAAVARVRSLAGTAGEPRREPYGVVADCTDDQGSGFTLLEMPTDAPRPPVNGAVAGDISYVTVATPDENRASEFYGALFGWRFSPGNVEHGRQVEGPAPMVGFWGGTRPQNVVLMYRVDDIGAAVARVRAHGGTASEPERQPYGITAECVDDQGMAFYLGQH